MMLWLYHVNKIWDNDFFRLIIFLWQNSLSLFHQFLCNFHISFNATLSSALSSSALTHCHQNFHPITPMTFFIIANHAHCPPWWCSITREVIMGKKGTIFKSKDFPATVIDLVTVVSLVVAQTSDRKRRKGRDKE